MAKYEFKLPDIGEGVTEGEIVSWLVNVGDSVTEDQEIVEVMTDKATVTIGAPKAGRVEQLGGKVGEVIPVGQTLITFELDPSAAPAAKAPASEPAATKPGNGSGAAEPAPEKQTEKQDVAASAVGDIRESLPGMNLGQTRSAPTSPAPSAEGYYNEKPLAAPATRKLARELGVDLRRVTPGGPAGRVTRDDVEAFARGGGAGASAPPTMTTAPAPSADDGAPSARPKPAAPVPRAQPIAGQEVEERVPLRGLRKRIYENMARSKHTAAHFTFVDECEVSDLRALRERVKPYAEREGVKLSFLPFIIKAVVAALKIHPALNCLVDDSSGEMVLRHNYDIGIAAATDAGLTVPVLRSADRLSILDIARELIRLSDLARDGKLSPADLGGSSFTITSLGRLGGLFATPIVNYPEVAILGVHEMKKKPVVRNDELAIGEVMLLSLSFDHRIIDGHVGAAFARTIIELLEDPDRLLVNMS